MTEYSIDVPIEIDEPEVSEPDRCPYCGHPACKPVPDTQSKVIGSWCKQPLESCCHGSERHGQQ